jgi:hypothetical protein
MSELEMVRRLGSMTLLVRVRHQYLFKTFSPPQRPMAHIVESLTRKHFARL